MTSMCWKGRNRLKIGTCLAINSTAGGLLTEGIGFEEKRIVGQIVLLCAFAVEIRGYSGRMRHCGGIFYNRRTEGARGKWKAHCKCRYRQCYYKNPFNGGMTRRLRRGSGTYRPKGHSHFSFDGERKVCKRKPAARRLQRRPAPLRVAGFGLREPFGLSSTSVRCAHPPGKRLLLPILPAAYRRSAPPQLALGRLKWRRLGCFAWLG